MNSSPEHRFLQSQLPARHRHSDPSQHPAIWAGVATFSSPKINTSESASPIAPCILPLIFLSASNNNEKEKQMTYLTMREAKLESGTTKNPILKAIKRGSVRAHKNDLGHWQIDRSTFAVWLASRAKTFEGHSSPNADHVECCRESSVRSRVKAKVDHLSALEREHWSFFRSAPCDARQDVLNVIFGIRQQRDLLSELLNT